MAAPDQIFFFFFCGGGHRGEGAKCDLRGQKSKELPEMADFSHFFF